MRKVTMVRLGIATAITALGVSGAMASGCTSSSSTSGSDGGSDGSSSGTGSSSGSSSGASSSGTSSGSSSGDTGAPPAPANLIVVHAAPGLGPFRFCFASATSGATASVEPFTALPDGPGKSAGFVNPPQPVPNSDGGFDTVPTGTPGVYPGTIAALPTFGTSVENLTITPFIIDASKIQGEINYDGGAGLAPDGGAEDTCTALVGGHGKGTGDTPAGSLTAGVDYWQLPDIAAGTLKDTKTYILALTGCLPGFGPSATEVGAGLEANPAQDITAANICGPGFDGGSPSLQITVNELDTTTSIPAGADGGIGVQFANLSTAIDNNPFIYPVTGLGVFVHPAASDGVWPGIPTESVVLGDGGFLEDGAANPPTETIVPGFSPLSTAPETAVPATGALPAAVPVSGLPILNSDGGAGPAAFGVLTAPGSLGDGGESLYEYPFQQTGAETISPGDQFPIPLSDIFTLSGWTASTASAVPYFVNGQSYVFVLLGSNDVGVPQLVDQEGNTNTAYDGRGLHIVAFPTTFTPSQVP